MPTVPPVPEESELSDEQAHARITRVANVKPMERSTSASMNVSHRFCGVVPSRMLTSGKTMNSSNRPPSTEKRMLKYRFLFNVIPLEP